MAAHIPANPGPSLARLASLFDLVAEELRKLAALPEDHLADVPNPSGHASVVVDHPHKRRGEERDEAQEAARAEPELLTAGEVARRLHCNTRTLRRWRHEARVPAPITMGARPRWRRADVETWIASRKETR